MIFILSGRELVTCAQMVRHTSVVALTLKIMLKLTWDAVVISCPDWSSEWNLGDSENSPIENGR